MFCVLLPIHYLSETIYLVKDKMMNKLFNNPTKLLKKSVLILGVPSLLLLSGCSHFHDQHGYAKNINRQTTHQDSRWNWQAPVNTYRPAYTHKLLSDYTEQLAMKLIENMKYVTDRTPVAVTSFVDLDNNLNTTTIFGNQLAESFITELQEFGLSVVDYKNTGKIEVTPTGDYNFSRNDHELKGKTHIEYVLSGTLTYNNRGVIVNARLIGTDTNIVVASAKGFIPNFVVESLHNGRYKDGIVLSAVN